MQQMEMADYENEPPRCEQKHDTDTNQTERRIIQVVFISFGLICITQAILNVTLRLSLSSSTESTPSSCSGNDMMTDWKKCCNTLQERLNALTRDKNMLENRITDLNNMIKMVEEQRDRLNQTMESTSQQCPQDWMTINSRCYFLSTEMKTWTESRTYCQSQGADLVVIKSIQEQRALSRLNGERYLLFWIGLHDMKGFFEWVDGSRLDRSKAFWQSGQPDHGGPDIREDCVEMYGESQILANWNDAPCESKRHWLCEKAQMK